MKSTLGKLTAMVAKAPIILVLIVVFSLGYSFRSAVVSTTPGGAAHIGMVHDAGSEGGTDAAAVWTCSMHPQIRLPEPGACPICGMDLVRADDSKKSQPKAKSSVRYACSMFCVPPMEKPGPCPICGMDMVAVEDSAAPDDQVYSELSLSPAAVKLAEIQTVKVERKFVEAKVRMVGKVEFDETRVRNITAWVPGRLDRLYVDYTGVPVQPGDHLVYLYSPDLLAAQEELIQALKAVGDLERSNIPSILETASGTVESVRDKLRLWGLTAEQVEAIEQRGTPSDHMTIYSPVGGIVIQKHAVEGMYVETGMKIYTIADLSRVWVKLDAYESDLAWIRYGQQVEFEVEAYPGETFTGQIAFIDPVLDPRTRTVKVRLNVSNANGALKPEMFVRAVARARIAAGGRVMDAALAGKWISPMHPEVVKDGPGSCDVCGMPLVRAEALGYVSVDPTKAEAPLVIPASAPLITGKRAVVYVEVADRPGTYQGREVVLGPRADDFYLVRDGLSEGEYVVTNGNFKIDSAVQIRAQPSMMSPGGGGSAPHAHDHNTAGTALPTGMLTGSKPEAFVVPDAFKVQLDAVYTAYFQIHRGLSRDDLAAARGGVSALVKAIQSVGMQALTGSAHDAWMRESGLLKKSADGLAAAKNIEQAREHFSALSDSLLVVAKMFPPTGKQPIMAFRCPMAFNNRGANWLQPTLKTENPYFGAAMFRCGALTEKIVSGSVNKRPGDLGHD